MMGAKGEVVVSDIVIGPWTLWIVELFATNSEYGLPLLSWKDELRPVS